MGIYVLLSQLDWELTHSCNKHLLNSALNCVTCLISFPLPSSSVKVFIQTLLCSTGATFKVGYHQS